MKKLLIIATLMQGLSQALLFSCETENSVEDEAGVKKNGIIRTENMLYIEYRGRSQVAYFMKETGKYTGSTYCAGRSKSFTRVASPNLHNPKKIFTTLEEKYSEKV